VERQNKTCFNFAFPSAANLQRMLKVQQTSGKAK